MNVLSTEFQTELTKAILQDHSFLQTQRHLISIDLFKDDVEKVLIKNTLEFYDKYASTPSKNSLNSYLIKHSYNYDDVNKEIDNYYENKVTDIDYIKDYVCDFVKKNKLKDVILRCGKLLDSGNYDEIYDRVKEVVFGYDNNNEIGSMFIEEAKSVLKQIDSVESYIPTGFDEFDEIMSGGAARGTLNVIITPPNRGKSTFLINIGKNAVLTGHKVVHYSFELSNKICNRRYFMSMVRMSKSEMSKKKRTAYDKFLDITEKIINNSLIIKKFPANSATPNDIRRHLNLIRNKHGFIPDLLIFDYADIMGTSKEYVDKRHEIEAIYYELRNIAEEFNSVNWTASQTNRGWKEKEFITMEDVDECYKKAAACDVMMSLNQTLDEKNYSPQTARLFITKNRDDQSQVSMNVETDWVKSWIGNL
jgi:replicative DNA helicase